MQTHKKELCSNLISSKHVTLLHSITNCFQVLLIGDYDARPTANAELFEEGGSVSFRITGYKAHAFFGATKICLENRD